MGRVRGVAAEEPPSIAACRAVALGIGDELVEAGAGGRARSCGALGRASAVAVETSLTPPFPRTRHGRRPGARTEHHGYPRQRDDARSDPRNQGASLACRHSLCCGRGTSPRSRSRSSFPTARRDLQSRRGGEQRTHADAVIRERHHVLGVRNPRVQARLHDDVHRNGARERQVERLAVRTHELSLHRTRVGPSVSLLEPEAPIDRARDGRRHVRGDRSSARASRVTDENNDSSTVSAS